MSNWNKPILAQPGAGMSVLVNTLSATPGAKPVVLDIGPSCQSFLSVDGRSICGIATCNVPRPTTSGDLRRASSLSLSYLAFRSGKVHVW